MDCSLIRAQVAGGHGSDAEKHSGGSAQADRLRCGCGSHRSCRSSIAASLSDFKRQQTLAERAASRGPRSGRESAGGQALQMEAGAWERMGKSQKTIDLSNQARELYVAAGDRRGRCAHRSDWWAICFSIRATTREPRSNSKSALAGVSRNRRAEKHSRDARTHRQCVLLPGKHARGEKLLRAGLAVSIARSMIPIGLASDYGNLANALDGLGDLTGSLKMQQESLAAFNKVGDRRGRFGHAEQFGQPVRGDGESGRGEESTTSSRWRMTREIAYRRGEPYPVVGLGDVLLAAGRLSRRAKTIRAGPRPVQGNGRRGFYRRKSTCLWHRLLWSRSDIPTAKRWPGSQWRDMRRPILPATVHGLRRCWRGICSAPANWRRRRALRRKAATLVRKSTGELPV